MCYSDLSAGLDAAARRANLSGRFRRLPVPLPPGCRLVLVDDVATSGATLTEAARALTAGAPAGDDGPVLAAVVAATVRRVPRPVTAPSPATFTVRSHIG